MCAITKVRNRNQYLKAMHLYWYVYIKKGQIPSNFYYLKKREKEVHISCHVFMMKASEYDWIPMLNSD